ncbi:MAG TPA: GGDEF domain-containing protein [Bryobacteraceae bacterium]|nr:GGDEF domain-containing protein [Bryobacteraceae bacterium]
MPGFDVLTAEAFTILNMLLAGTGMFLVSTLNKRSEGVRRCAVSCLILLLGFVLYPARLIIPGRLIVLLPNLLVFAGMMVLLDGVRAFRGYSRHTGIIISGSAAYFLALCYFLFIDDNINYRTAIEMLVVVICAGFLAAAMFANVEPRDRRIYWPTASGMVLHGVVSVFKGIDAIWGLPINYLTPHPIDFYFTVTLNICIVGCAFGLFLAINLKLQRETEALALFDSLTQLPNRRFFEENLEAAERRAFESGHRIALIYCDLDDFKGINDALGHEGGDMALKQVGERLRATVGEKVCLARVGGDEFLLLVEDAHSRDRVHGLIQQLRSAVEGEVEFDGRSATVKISCGLAIYPDDVGSVSDLIRLADAAMYVMKQHGRSVPAGSEDLVIESRFSASGRISASGRK